MVALTGASRGIGLATARALCGAGYTVVAGARDVRPLEAAGLGRRLRAVRLDLADEGSIEQFAAAVGATARGAAGAADRGSEGAAGEGAGAGGAGRADAGGAGRADAGGADAGGAGRADAGGASAGGAARADAGGADAGGAARADAGGASAGGAGRVDAGGAGAVGAGRAGAGGAVEGAAWSGPGGLVAVINNAGVGALGAAEEFPLERAREVFETNLWGAARLAQLLLPLLRAGAAAERPTYLVNVGSLIAEYPVPFHACYAASKGALRAYTLALRGELAGHGVAVVLLEPGDIATGITPLQDAAPGAVYGADFARVSAARAVKMAAAPGPEAVARRLLRVLGRRRPPPIVACGGAAPLLRLVRRLLPDRVAQHLTLRAYGLRRGAGSPK